MEEEQKVIHSECDWKTKCDSVLWFNSAEPSPVANSDCEFNSENVANMEAVTTLEQVEDPDAVLLLHFIVDLIKKIKGQMCIFSHICRGNFENSRRLQTQNPLPT